MLNWYMRYEPFIRVLDGMQAESVLDVGSGWYGLSWYWPHTVVQTDLDFAGTPPKQCRPGEASFVCSTAEHLPFADDAFDVVLSSDMLEHLPADVRAPSVAELTRVARRAVLIGFPTGPAARNDRLIARLHKMRGRELPCWLEEHLAQDAYPDRQTVTNALPEGWWVAAEFPNGNAALSAAVGVAEMLRPTAPIASRLERFVQRHGLPKVSNRGSVVRTVYLIEPAVSPSVPAR